MWDIDRMKPLSATVVLSYFIYSELLPFYGIIDSYAPPHQHKVQISHSAGAVNAIRFLLTKGF